MQCDPAFKANNQNESSWTHTEIYGQYCKFTNVSKLIIDWNTFKCRYIQKIFEFPNWRKIIFYGNVFK